jgi:hypothetical protein
MDIFASMNRPRPLPLLKKSFQQLIHNKPLPKKEMGIT